jgi:basic amino acid/polyamine antiporter, APA family
MVVVEAQSPQEESSDAILAETKNMQERNAVPDRQDNLPRTLKFADVLLLIISSIIGSGIFFVSSTVATQLFGDTGLILMAWLAGGVLSMLGALTLAELTALRPEAGGIYVFIRECYGQLPAFLYGWTLFFVISSGTMAALAVAFSDNLRAILPMSSIEAKIAAIGVILGLAALNVRGTRYSANVQNLAAVIKIGSVLTISCSILAKVHGAIGLHTFLPHPFSWSVTSSFGLSLVAILWAYEGWQYATYSAGETINPRRNFPLAFLIGMSTVIVVYLTANIAYIAALGPAGVARSSNVAADAMTRMFGRPAAAMVVIAIGLSVVGGANGLLLTNTRVYYAMARDGVFFAKLADVHPRFRTPAFAIIAGSGWAAILALSGTFHQLLTSVMFIGWLFYALAVSCIFVHRRRFRTIERPYRMPGYPWTPVLFLLAATALAANTLVHQPMRSLVGLSIVALGIPAYQIWHRSFVSVRRDETQSAAIRQ